MFNSSIRRTAGHLFCDDIRVADIVAEVGTPVYIYSLKRALENYERIRAAFAPLDAHVHFSAKANGSLAVLRALVGAGAGIDAVSGGEVYLALKAGASAENIVFAGVGKTMYELYFAVQQNIGWINLENAREAELLNSIALTAGKTMRVSVRLNPEVHAQTHPHIATGHGGAKFGMTADAVLALYARRAEFPALRFEGLHIHIGSQLGDVEATCRAAQAAVDLARALPTVNTIDIGGGFPVAYKPDAAMPDVSAFAGALAPILAGYQVLLEPGRSIIADAGLLVTRVLYLKEQGGAAQVIVDAGMTDLLRPALYDAYHAIVPVYEANPDAPRRQVNVVGPVCETTDVLARGREIPPVAPNDYLALLTAGAYGMAMSSNYNARPRPPEVVVEPDGKTWRIARRRESWDDLVALES
ncbi:MAG: diaminopimelate decarboxylase [Anaerolineae bacterium]|nr:diaminopimelate decarboxylase [Anaerolineae bacterium]